MTIALPKPTSQCQLTLLFNGNVKGNINLGFDQIIFQNFSWKITSFIVQKALEVWLDI